MCVYVAVMKSHWRQQYNCYITVYLIHKGTNSTNFLQFDLCWYSVLVGKYQIPQDEEYERQIMYIAALNTENRQEDIAGGSRIVSAKVPFYFLLRMIWLQDQRYSEFMELLWSKQDSNLTGIYQCWICFHSMKIFLPVTRVVLNNLNLWMNSTNYNFLTRTTNTI